MRILDEHCDAIGRDPGDITRSSQIIVSYDNPVETRAVIRDLVHARITHIVLGLPTPYPIGVARWAEAELIAPAQDEARHSPASAMAGERRPTDRETGSR